MPSPAIVSQETYAALVEAVHPSSAEVLRVKDALRARLAVGAANTDELENGVAEVMGLPPIAPREDPYDVHPEVPIASRVDRDAVPIKRVRIRYAARLALAELAAEGVIVPAETRSNDYVTVAVHQRGHSGGERIEVVTPHLAGAYTATPGKSSLTDPPMLDAASLPEDLKVCLTLALAAAWKRPSLRPAEVYISAPSTYSAR